MVDDRFSGWPVRQAAVLFILFVQLYDCKELQTPRITSLNACTDIKYRFATTRISSHVINPDNRTRQAVFDITLPNDAFISNFSLTVEDKTYPGRVEERGEALRKYGANGTDGDFTSGKVTQRPRETNRFRVTLKVAPLQEVSFNLTYKEILERRLGYYDHVLYIDPGQPVEDMRVDVSIEENREISYLHVPPIRSDILTNDFDISETNSLVRVERPSGRHAYISYSPSAKQQQIQGGSRDGLSGLFTVRYDVGRSMDAGELLSVNGYFVHFIAPPVQEAIPKDVLFILDTSTSMMLQKLGQLQDAMRVILHDLTPGDRFALMQFNSRATFWRRELLPVNNRTIQWALRYVDSLKARGYTNIDSAMDQGLDFFNEDPTVKGNNSLIIFLTDGRSTRGETDRNNILRHVSEKNMKNVTVYGLAFGKDADWPLVKKMAGQNDGVGRRIYQDADAALQIHGFYDEVSTLLLTGVQAKYLDSEVDVETLTKTLFRKFFNGSEMVVAGKLIQVNQTALEIFVQATGLKGKVNLTIVPDPDPLTPGEVKSCGLLKAEDLASVVEKMWAYLTIRQLLQKRVGEDDPLTKQELRSKATELALKYNFVTPVTSLVVTKPGSDELAFLQEDASDLVDDLEDSSTTTPISSSFSSAATVPPAESSTKRDSSGPPSGSGDTAVGSPSRGGGGGDPHFMVEMTSLPYPLCFDLTGETGDVFRLLRDPETGLTVNVEVGKGRWKLPGSTRLPVYITKAAILLQDDIAEITTAHVKVNDVLLRWGTLQSVYVPGVWVMMNNSTLRFALDWSVEIDVTRSLPHNSDHGGEAFLNVEIQNEVDLSKESTGLLGQFVHKHVRLEKLKKRHGRLVAELEVRDERGGHSHVRHGRALLKKRRDAYFRRQTPCLMVDAPWSHTLDRPTRLYKVRSLYDI